MTSGRTHQLEASSREEAYRLLANGRYREALRAYGIALSELPTDPVLLSEQACAHAALRHRNSVLEIAGKLPGSTELSQVQARMKTAEAWLSLGTDRWADVEKLLQESVAADASFAPPVLTLARYWLWSRGDSVKARTFVEMASGLGPRSLPWYLTALGLEAEDADFRAASRIAGEGSKAFPSSVKLRLGAALSALASTPRQGFLITSVLSLGVVIPYAGIFVYAALTVLMGAGLLFLRGVSRRLWALAAVNMLVFSLMLGARAIIWGRLYP